MKDSGPIAEDLVTQIHAEIRERLESSRAAKLESERLEAALAALDDQDRTASTARRRTGGSPNARASSRSRRSRAPRGANRTAVLAAVEQQPDATPREIRTATGVQGNTLHALLRTLVAKGELRRTDLPDGKAGYRLPAAPVRAPADAGDPTPEDTAASSPEPT